MKSFSVYTILLGVASAAAVSSSPKNGDSIAWMPLVWTGRVKPGEGNVTLTGTAAEIHDQILAINPEYDTQLGYKKPGSDLARRHGPTPDNPINTASRNCNVFTLTDADQAMNGIDRLYAIGNGGCSAPAGWGGCVRCTCDGYGASVYLCNDHPDPITVPCKFVADNALGVDQGCMQSYYSGGPGVGTWYHYTNGQIFSFDSTWNVIVTSSNCNASPADPPH